MGYNGGSITCPSGGAADRGVSGAAGSTCLGEIIHSGRLGVRARPERRQSRRQWQREGRARREGRQPATYPIRRQRPPRRGPRAAAVDLLIRVHGPTADEAQVPQPQVQDHLHPPLRVGRSPCSGSGRKSRPSCLPSQETFDSKLRGESSAPTVWGRAKNGHGIPYRRRALPHV